MTTLSTQSMPAMIYGTAWKQESTEELVQLALDAGFVGIDTANQKKHYREDFVGDCLDRGFRAGLKRESLFLQSKYTYQRGQDHRLPYNPSDSFTKQVQSSFANTLLNLHTDYIDSFLLHGPYQGEGLHEADWESWQAMSAILRSGQVKKIGVSNVTIGQLRELYDKSEVKPSVVQNRCYAERGWDKEVRDFCKQNDIVYQGFSLLTANRQVLVDKRVLQIADRDKLTPAQVVFCFAQQIGMTPITGTTNPAHMREDLATSGMNNLESELAELEAGFLI